MLTGDKLETADNIARSCKLIDEGYLINSNEMVKERCEMLKIEVGSIDEVASPVIDGSAVNFNDV